MRSLVAIVLAGCSFAGHGEVATIDGGRDAGDATTPGDTLAIDAMIDADPINDPTPTVIPGGGVMGGAILGVVHVYVLDAATRAGSRRFATVDSPASKRSSPSSPAIAARRGTARTARTSRC